MLGGTAYASYICKQKQKKLIYQQNAYNSL